MSQTASNPTGEQRRRSTRLLETIPLAILGIDLLGQPFEERTATLAINFHGCRYSSKHHLPKNTWLTLQVADQDAENGRRSLRARVAWIQRPRVARELFQIGVELETPGNVWGIAYPPLDWSGTSSEFFVEQPPANPPPFEKQGMPSATETALPGPLAGYIDHLLAEARLHGQTPESYGEAEETSPLLRELSVQLERQSERTVEAAASRADHLIRRASEEIDREMHQYTESLRKEWRKEFEGFRTEASEQAAARFTESERAFRAGLESAWEASLNNGRELLAQFDQRAEALHAELTNLAEATASRVERARLELESVETAIQLRRESQRDRDEPSKFSEETRAAWREQMQAEMGMVRDQWSELLQSSLDSAVQRLVARLSENSQSLLSTAEQRMAAKVAEASQPMARSMAEARESLGEIRASLEREVARAGASLGEIERAADRMSAYSGQLEAASQDKLNELHRRADGILASQTAELNRRAESALGGAAERLGALLEAAGQQSIAGTVGELEAKLAPHVERAQSALRQLSAREEQSEDALRIHRERLRQISEQLQRDAAAQQAGILSQLHGDFEVARREAIAKWNEELETSRIRATHNLADEMVKASELHQQKAQNDLDIVAEASLQSAARGLEEKSSEAAQKFAAEIEHQGSRQVEWIREKAEAVAEGLIGQSQGRFLAAAEAAALSFREILAAVSAEEHERFVSSSDAAFEERAARLRAVADEMRGKLDGDSQQFVAAFQRKLAEQTERNLAEAQGSFERQMGATLDSLQARREVQEREWSEGMERLNEQSLKQYDERLRTAGDSWMVGSVRKLNEHGQNVIDSLSKAAEQSLRNTCSRIFDSLAMAMRERMMGVRDTPSAAAVPLPDEDPGPSEKFFKP